MYTLVRGLSIGAWGALVVAVVTGAELHWWHFIWPGVWTFVFFGYVMFSKRLGD